MKSTIAASIVTVGFAADPALPKLKDKCCTPLDQIPVTKPTQAWVCGKLQDTYNQLWGECNNFVTTEMDALKISEYDTTFHDSYTKEYKIEAKQTHIQKWFTYYCPAVETDAEEDFAADEQSLSDDLGEDGTGLGLLLSGNSLAQTSLPQVRGAGPLGKFPGNFNHWTEKEDLYNQLFYEITQTWFYCQHRSLKAFYTMEKVKQEAAMKQIWDEYQRQKGNWRDLIRNEMDPRRIWLGKFIRYNIHQNEYHEWTLRPILNYEKVYAKAAELGQSETNNVFCDNYREENASYLERLHNIRGKFQTGFDQIVQLGDDEDFGGRVNAFTKKDLIAAKAFPMDVYFEFWKPQIKCYIEKNGENQEIEDFWKLVRFYTVEDNSKFSMNCNYRRLLNRVRYWQYVTLAETQQTKTDCNASFERILEARSKIISYTGENAKNTWETPAVDELDEEKVEENRKKVQTIVSFLNDWENLDERLYDSKGGRTNIINEFTTVAKTAMEVYYWNHRMGDQAMDYHVQDKSWQKRAWWYARSVTNTARTDFRKLCWRPLSQQLFLITPRY